MSQDGPNFGIMSTGARIVETIPSVAQFLSTREIDPTVQETLEEMMQDFPALTPTVIAQLQEDISDVAWKDWSDADKTSHLLDCIESSARLYRQCKH